MAEAHFQNRFPILNLTAHFLPRGKRIPLIRLENSTLTVLSLPQGSVCNKALKPFFHYAESRLNVASRISWRETMSK